MRITSRFTLLILAAVFATGLRAAKLATAEQAKSAEIKVWAADPPIVTAAVAHHAPMPADQAGMPRDNWKTLSLLDPFRRFAKNEATNDHRDFTLAGWRLASRPSRARRFTFPLHARIQCDPPSQALIINSTS